MEDNTKQLSFNAGLIYSQELIQDLAKANRSWQSGDFKKARIRYYGIFMAVSPFLKEEQIESFKKLNIRVLESIRSYEKYKSQKDLFKEAFPTNKKEPNSKYLKTNYARIGVLVSEMDMALRKYCDDLALLIPEKENRSYFGN